MHTFIKRAALRRRKGA